MNYYTDTLIKDNFLLFTIAILIASFLIIPLYFLFYLPFKEEKEYIKMEMSRSSEKEEYLYWKKELRMLYISKIPIIRSIVGKKRKR